MDARSVYLPLDAAAAELGIPRTYLRKLADAGRVPCLRIGPRRLFVVADVLSALRQSMTEGAAQNTGDKISTSDPGRAAEGGRE